MDKDKKNDSRQVRIKGRISVLVASVLLIGAAFSTFAVMKAHATPPTWKPPITITPSMIYPGETFNGSTNFTHPDDPGIGDVGDLNSGRIYIQDPITPPCTGPVNDTATVDPQGGMPPVYRVHVEDYDPTSPPFNLVTPGSYRVYFWFADTLGMGMCSGSGRLDILPGDDKPPRVAGHGEPLGASPYFNVNPVPKNVAPYGVTYLYVIISDEWTGSTYITDGEYFVCGPSVIRCGPDPSWVYDFGNKLILYETWPWGGFPPPPQHWDEFTKVFTKTGFDVSTWPVGTYWVWIHGADCGEDSVCQGGAPGSDDNWGDFWNAGQEGTAWVAINLTVISGRNQPVLSWTGEPGFVNDGVNPDIGFLTTVFEYRINYTDADNDPPAPGYPKVHIEKPCGVPWRASPYAMMEVDSSDFDYTNGKLYTYSTTLSPEGTDYAYYFSAYDGFDWAVGVPTIPCTDGPDVNAVPPPANLWVERNDPDIILHWDGFAAADHYNVYLNNNRLAPFSGWSVVPGVSGTSWTHAGAHNDGMPWFYIVRTYNITGGESSNSTMGVKEVLLFGMTNPYRNINWISLPYRSIYKKASDITNELGPTKIDVVGKWDPAQQKSIVYYYGRGKWRGQNFDINPGDGIFINSINSNWEWIINGTDYEQMLTFVHNLPLKANINWISLPYTNSYEKASNIVMDIEGSLFISPMNITTVGLWDPVSQTDIRFYWNATLFKWEGMDFNIMPGDGHYLDIINNFTWTPKLITPSVP